MRIYYTHSYNGNKGESHRLLERVIALETGNKDCAAELVSQLRNREPYGKPYIEGFCEFSISHSNGTWAVLFSDESCGLDIQYEREPGSGRSGRTENNYIAIARRFFAPEDSAAVQTAAANALSGSFAYAAAAQTETTADMFFRLWTAREALVKAAGMSVAASDVPSVINGRTFWLGESWIITFIGLPEVPEGCRLHAAVCTRGKIPDGDIRYIRLGDDMRMCPDEERA